MKIQASSVSKYLGCPASFYLEQMFFHYIREKDSPKAIRGKFIHAMAETILTCFINGEDVNVNGYTAKIKERYPKEIFSIRKQLSYYLNYYKKVFRERGKMNGMTPIVGVEKKFRRQIKKVDCVAKVDSYIQSHTKDGYHVDIFDLKTGTLDYTVFAEEQLLFSVHLYVIRNFQKTFKEKINYTWHIVQADCYDYNSPSFALSGTTTVKDSLLWLEQNIKYIIKNRNLFIVGNQCRFCSVLSMCPQKQEWTKFSEQFIDNYVDNFSGVASEQLEHIFLQTKTFKQYLVEVEKELLHRIDTGESMNKVYVHTTAKGNKKLRAVDNSKKEGMFKNIKE